MMEKIVMQMPLPEAIWGILQWRHL